MKKIHVIGVMSGTSLDGIDFAEIIFTYYNNEWSFELFKCETVAYSEEWVDELKRAVNFSDTELESLNKNYTFYLGDKINQFIKENNIVDIDAVCSHGHTILHEPDKGITLQIGNLPFLKDLIKQNLVCDFRVADVLLGGQGAPLVPIGDKILFSEYTYCINLGGFANVSFDKDGIRIAYDICAVNVVLNYYANLLDLNYDNEGALSRSGKLNVDLFNELNSIDFYKETAPKSLGMEWVNSAILPLIEKFNIPIEDKLHTFVKHVAKIITENISAGADESVFLSGGGVYHVFLIYCIRELTSAKLIIPSSEIIEYKEALIFGLLGVLKLENNNNVLSSVTGSKCDHSSGNVFLYNN